MSLRVLTNFSGKTKLLTHNFRTLFNSITPTQLTRSYSDQIMRFIRFQKSSDNRIHIGALSEDGKSYQALDQSLPNDMIELIKSNPGVDSVKSNNWEPLTDDIKLLAPIQNPEKIICIGLNYLGHCKEQNKEAPKEPMFFSKYASTITGPTGDVILHEITNVCTIFFLISPRKKNANSYVIILFLTILLSAIGLGSRIGRDYWKRGTKSEQSKCI